MTAGSSVLAHWPPPVVGWACRTTGWCATPCAAFPPVICTLHSNGSRPAALLAVLARRLAQPPAPRMLQRRQTGEQMATQLIGIARPGAAANDHSHWVPVL
jgi:hypothetical protein